MLRRILLAFVLSAIALPIAFAADVNPPVPISLPMRDGTTRRGNVVEFDATMVKLGGNAGQIVEIAWADVQPRAVLAINERLIGPKGTARQWLELGRTLQSLPDGAPLAQRPLAIALRMDPSLKSEIDDVRSGRARAPAGGNTVADDSPLPPGERRVRSRLAWPELSEEQMNEAVEQLKKRVGELLTKSPAKLTLHETRYFLFYSNLPQSEAGKWVAVLDRMYARLAELFGLEAGHNLWRGKAAILVFLSRDDFLKFEKEAFNNDREAGGRCHAAGNGDVIITFYRWPDDLGFARVLVHESTHGFLHRYRSPGRVPSWANEGLAEVMEFELVPHAGSKQQSDAEARANLRRADALSGFFEADSIEFYQYPIARSLTEFMIRQNKQGYVEFINGIKEGLSWERSLEERYGTTVDQLVSVFGNAMGMRDLRRTGN